MSTNWNVDTDFTQNMMLTIYFKRDYCYRHNFLRNTRATINFKHVVVFFILPVSWLETRNYYRLESIQIRTYSISEAASGSKMPKNYKKQNFGEMSKNNVFFMLRSHLFDFRSRQWLKKCLKMIKSWILVKWLKITFFSGFEATRSISEAASDS